MPYANVPADKTAAMDSCVTKVKAQGHSEDSAIGICYTSVVEGMDLETAMREHPEQHVIEAAIIPRPDAKGKEWEITIAGPENGMAIVHGREYVKSQNGRLYSCDALRASVPMWDGAQVYDNDLTNADFKTRGGMRSVAKEWIGSIVNPWWDETARELKGIFKVVDDAIARKLLNAHTQEILKTVGLSMDTFIDKVYAVIEGQRVELVEGFKKIVSVDLVANPAAGGGFNRLIAATQQGAMHMSDETTTAVEQVEQEMPPEAPPAAAIPPELVDLIRQLIAEALAAAQAPAPEAPVEENAEDDETPVLDTQESDEEAATQERIDKLESRIALQETLTAARLPEDAANLVREAFDDRIFERTEVERMVESIRKVAANHDTSGRVQGVGGRAPMTAGMSPEDWREVEFMRLMAGNMKFRRLESIEDETVQDRLAESRGYQAWLKNGRQRGQTRRMSEWLIQGFGDPLERAFEAATTSSLSSIVKNAVNILLASDFQARHQWWTSIVREEEVDTIDAPTLIRWFGLSTLDVVDEGQAYTELALVDEEETAAFVKRGNYVAITMETLLRDKVNKVQSIPELLADSWYNTLSKYAAAVFTTNTNAGPLLVGSAGNLFNATAATTEAGHANLLTSPLSYTSYVAARVAMAKQTNADVGLGVRLLIRPKVLLVPEDLEQQALQIIESPNIPGKGDNDINPYQGEVDVVVVPEWTDANNWALVADPMRYPAIWNLYYRGRRVPELYTADSETEGSMFTNDTLRYKVRQLTFRYSSTYDCFPVSDFRPLHKNNVA